MTTEKGGGRKRRRDASSTPPPRTLKQYSVEEKLDIIDYAKNTGNRAAGREFNVAESSIREWRKHEVKLRETLASGGGAKVVNVVASLNSNIRLPTSLSLLPALNPLPITSVSSSSSPSSSDSSTTSCMSSSNDSEVSGSRKRKATAPRKIVLDD